MAEDNFFKPMKIELEQQDIEAMAKRVVELLRPVVASLTHAKQENSIYDVQALAAYLGVTKSWIHKKVSLKAIPYFKVGKYTRFRKKDIDRWIESQTAKPIK